MQASGMQSPDGLSLDAGGYQQQLYLQQEHSMQSINVRSVQQLPLNRFGSRCACVFALIVHTHTHTHTHTERERERERNRMIRGKQAGRKQEATLAANEIAEVWKLGGTEEARSKERKLKELKISVSSRFSVSLLEVQQSANRARTSDDDWREYARGPRA